MFSLINNQPLDACITITIALCVFCVYAHKMFDVFYVFVLGIYFLIMILLGFPASVISLFIRSENSLFPSVLRACFYFVHCD